MTELAATMKETGIAPDVLAFIARLADLRPGPRAQLKRNSGNMLAQSRGVLPLFYGLLPRSVMRPRDIETYFLVATLYGFDPSGGGQGNFARTLRGVAQLAGVNRDGVDRRVAILLDSHRGELPFRLRQAVQFVAGQRHAIDWPRLLEDLLRWEHPDRVVQKAWARSYFGSAD